MSYRSILIHVGNTTDLEQRVKLAARLASADRTTVVGLAISGNTKFMSRFLSPADQIASGISSDQAFPADELAHRGKRHLEMTRSLARFATLAQQYGIASVQQLHVDDDAASALSAHGSAADLIILGKNDLQHPARREESDLVEFVTLNTTAPVFTVNEKPFSWRHALVAWNGSSVAARAARNALPILEKVDLVSAVIFGDGIDPSTHAIASEDALRQCLSTIPKPVNVIHRTETPDTGHALLALADELDADLIVMGCVAHPRWRETLLGGTTGVVIAESSTSLLLSR
ncbi:universal stress protein [Herbaspirillum hiltneri]|nr:universal stress protein [Herbaspirillum hiltneri]